MRKDFNDKGITGPQITRLGAPGENTWQVRTEFIPGDTAQAMREALGKVVAAR